MEEATSWKARALTLLVFTGIVVLCSIFFILGMLVARAQAQKVTASDTSAASVLKANRGSGEDKQDLTFYDSVKKEPLAAFERAPASLDPPVLSQPPAKSDPEPESVIEASSTSANLVHYQIGAVRKPADAEKLLDELKKKGFRAFILAPSPDDENPFFRVQVGPFSDPIEALEAKNKLEAAGYQAIVKR